MSADSNRHSSPLVVIVRGFAALVSLAALVVGVPGALVGFVGSPLPTGRVDPRAVVEAFSRSGVSEGTVIKALAIVVWLAWFRLIAGLLVELVGRMAHRQPRQVRFLGSGQVIASRLLTSIVLMGTVFSGVRGAGAMPANPIAPGGATSTLLMTASPVSRHLPSAADRSHAQAQTRASGAAEASARSAPMASPTTPSAQWMVHRNDSFWGIAEATLGDGMRWREVVEANIGREVAPGVIFTASTETIHPGWVLALPVALASQPTTSEPASPTVQRVVVRPGETLAAIADAQYGDPAAWTVLWGANGGHQFGDRVFDDPNLILPGWELTVPDDVAGLPELPTGDRRADSPPVESRPELEVEVPAVGPGDALDHSSIDQPSARTPADDQIDVTTTPSPSPSASASAKARDLPPSAATAMVGASTVNRIRVHHPDAPCPDAPLLSPLTPAQAPARATEPVDDQGVLMPVSIGGSLLAGGVLALTASRRRRQLRLAQRGAVATVLPADLVGALRELSDIAAPERLARLDAALRAAASQLAEVSTRSAVVAALVDPSGTLELAIQPPSTNGPTAPFVGDGARWLLPAEVSTEDIAPRDRRFAAFPNPTIVHIGASVGCDAYVDLEAVGLLTIDGQGAEDVLRAIVTGLAVSPFAELARLVRFGHGDIATVGRGERVDSLDAALDLAADAVAPILNHASAGDTAAVLRIRSTGEPWEPVVLAVGGAELGDGDETLLLEMSVPASRGLGIVTDTVIAESAWCLVETPSGWVLDPLGWAVEPLGLSRSSAQTLGALVDHASLPLGPSVRPAHDQPDASSALGFDGRCDAYFVDHESHPSNGAQASVGRSDHSTMSSPVGDAEPTVVARPARDWRLMVRVLGAVDVVSRDGSSAAFEKSKALELLAWLTEHRRSATRTGARSALWDNDVRDATFANVVSDARRSLARLSQPEAGADEWVGRTLTERLVLHPLVISDMDLVRDALDRSRDLDDHDAVEVLRSAVELIRGVPFSGVAYLWADTEALGSNAALVSITVASELAERALRVGDVECALWATSRGLLALPGHEELVALRLRAHACRGDLAGLRQEWDQYERVLEADPWLDAEPSASLVRLRHDLLAGLRVPSTTG